MILKRVFSKIAIVAGMPSADWKGAKILKSLQNIHPGSQFFGVGGEKMATAGLTSEIDISILEDKPFYPIMHYDVDPRFYGNLTMIWYHLQLILTQRSLDQSLFWKHFKNPSEVDMVVTIDNQLLAFKVLEKLDKLILKNDFRKPPVVHFGNTIRNYKFDYLKTIDYLVYTLPLASKDVQKFDFPSQFVGKQVVYDALRYIYSQTKSHQKLVNPEFIVGDLDNTLYVTRDVRQKVAASFREKKILEKETFLIFISPGDQETEIRANIKLCISAIIKLTNIYQGHRPMAIVFSLPNKNSKNNWIIEEMKAVEIPVKFIYGNENNARFEAMAASDIGAIAKGDSLFEAATLHLPTVALDNQANLKGYIDLMYNKFSTEINWVFDGVLFPELTCWSFDDKLVEFWSEYIEKPNKKFETAKRFDSKLFTLLPKIEQLNLKHNLKLEAGQGFQICLSPDLVTEKFLGSVLNNFQKLKEQNKNTADYNHKKRELLLEN